MPDQKPVSMEDLYGINITGGVPSEIHVGIDRGHYDDEDEPLHAVARDVAAAFTGPGRMLLILDDDDYGDVQNAIVRRQRQFGGSGKLDNLPDGKSNVAGAAIAEICRGWMELVALREAAG